jgi:hypothetical protein
VARAGAALGPAPCSSPVLGLSGKWRSWTILPRGAPIVDKYYRLSPTMRSDIRELASTLCLATVGVRPDSGGPRARLRSAAVVENRRRPQRGPSAYLHYAWDRSAEVRAVAAACVPQPPGVDCDERYTDHNQGRSIPRRAGIRCPTAPSQRGRLASARQGLDRALLGPTLSPVSTRVRLVRRPCQHAERSLPSRPDSRCSVPDAAPRRRRTLDDVVEQFFPASLTPRWRAAYQRRPVLLAARRVPIRLSGWPLSRLPIATATVSRTVPSTWGR